METLSRIWRGDAGLARTYWLFGILAGFAWAIPMATVTPGSIAAVVVVLLYLAYYVMVNVGVWRAAGKYSGPKVWAVLARLAVAAIPALMVIGTIAAIVIPAATPQQKAIEPSSASPYPGLVPFNGKLDGE